MLRLATGSLVTLSVLSTLFGCSASGSGDEPSNVPEGRGGSGSGVSFGGAPPVGNAGAGVIFGGSTGSGGAGSGVNGARRCDNMLSGIIRDFDPRSHPDFEPFDPTITMPVARAGKILGDDRGMVAAQLGPDFKPVYVRGAGSPTTYGEMWFHSWFRDTVGVNMSTPFTIAFTDPDGDKVFTFDNGGQQFFPIDGQGFGNWPFYNNGLHNYSFTYELHAKFIYRAGMRFQFSGDDDVWVFINGNLAVDIGGIHGREELGVNLDDLRLTPGSEYQLDFFWAERHVSQSNFRIDTSMEFTDCDLDIPR